MFARSDGFDNGIPAGLGPERLQVTEPGIFPASR
jgi:hypothetical protein